MVASSEVDSAVPVATSGAAATATDVDTLLPAVTSSSADAGGSSGATETAADAAPVEEAETDGQTRLHVSCRDFGKCPQEKVQAWLAKTSLVSLTKVFKLKGWGYAFVSVKPEEAAKFREAIDGATYRNALVTVKDGHLRDANSRRPKGQEDDEPNAKRQKTAKSFPEGYVPTLKDLQEKAKSHKGAGIEKTILQKSAPLLEYPYDVQLKMKETYVKTAVRNFTKQIRVYCDKLGLPGGWSDLETMKQSGAPHGCGCPVDPIIGTASDRIVGYRNKCEFTIGKTPDGVIDCGFVLKIVGDGDQLISNADEVPHVSAAMKKLCGVMREHVKASTFDLFERKRDVKTGVWRLVMARQSPKGELLIVVQIATVTDEVRDQLGKALVASLVAADLGVVAVFLQENDSNSDAAPADARLFHIHGCERLEMPLLGLRFEIGPLSFFQTNSSTCELLYERALSWLRPEGGIVLDICCGVGTIGLCAASRCKRMVGLELVPEAVESARQNATLNGITNASFHVGKAEKVLPSLLPKLLKEEGEDCEVCAMVDPPRAGLHKDVLTALRDCSQLSRIVYISCNPESLADDVVKLCSPQADEDCLVPVRAVAVDMFPHTMHCEMILLLERSSKVRLQKSAEVDAATAVSKPVST